MKQFLGYSFYINQDGTYAFYLAGPSAGQYLRNGSSPFIKTGLNQTNLIAVVARGSTIYLYVNKQYITSLSDNTFSSGQIGVLVNENSLPTEVMFQNVQVWNV